MHPVLKITIGTLMVILGIYSSLTYSSELVNLVQAFIGPLLVLVGAFIIWLESDELKLSTDKRKSSQVDVQQSLKEQTQPTKTRENQTLTDSTNKTNQADKIECPDCGKQFDTERGMKIHRTQKHK